MNIRCCNTPQPELAQTVCYRTLRAITARFGLELIQYNMVNAFMHAEIPYNVLMRMPRGFKKQDRVLKINKTLHGLRKSSLLWQKFFNAALREAGWESVKHKPCCWVRAGVIPSLYVNDIVVAFREEKRAEAINLVAPPTQLVRTPGRRQSLVISWSRRDSRQS